MSSQPTPKYEHAGDANSVNWQAVRQRLKAQGYRVGMLFEGFALVELDGKFGFVDRDGRLVVPLRYDFALFFREGRAKVRLNGKWGFVDPSGTEVVPLRFDCAWSFSEGRAAVMLNGEEFEIDRHGKRIQEEANALEGTCVHSSLATASATTTKLSRVHNYLALGFVPPALGLALNLHFLGNPFLTGWACMLIFGWFIVTVASVFNLKLDTQSYEEGLLCEGHAMVERNGLWGYIDKGGSIDGQANAPESTCVHSSFTTDPDTPVMKKQETSDWEAVRSRLESEGYQVGSLHEGRARVERDGKIGFVDAAGTVVVPLRYNYAGLFREGRADVKRNGLWGFIDRDGRVVVPLQYNDAWAFRDGRAVVEKDGKCGFVDPDGTEVVPLRYDHAFAFFKGRAIVEKDGKWGYVDRAGREVVRPQYDEARPFSEGRALVKMNGKYGFIDPEGTLVVPLNCDDAEHFIEGRAWVELNDEQFWISPDGSRLD